MSTRAFFVTGSASGIGLHLTRVLLSRGERVFATDLNLARLEELAASEGWPRDRLGLSALDVRDSEAWDRAVAAAVERFGAIDVALNFAGCLHPAWVMKIKPEEVHLHFDVNTKGVIFGTMAAAAAMSKRGSGHIVNMASIAGLVPLSGLALYSASKYAVRAFTLAAAPELKRHGVDVTVVCPDGVRTPMLEHEKHFEESALVFSGSRILTVEDIEKAILGPVLRKRPLEIYLPPSRGWLARMADLLPGVFFKLDPIFRRRGLAVQKRLRGES